MADNLEITRDIVLKMIETGYLKKQEAPGKNLSQNNTEEICKTFEAVYHTVSKLT